MPIFDRINDLVPTELEGTEQYLDLCTWNIKFFTAKPRRIETITSIMKEINADIYVLQEIADGAMDEVVHQLNLSGEHSYKVVYGKTGGDIRVTFMYDLEKVRAKQDIEELFQNERIIAENGIEAFPRLPLHGRFQVTHNVTDPFDFELVGVHLKSQRGNGWEQRKKAAEKLVDWIQTKAQDEDVIIAGDFNAPPGRREWKPFEELEEKGEILFKSFNPNGELSHLSGSRLDCILITDNVNEASIDSSTTVIRWKEILDGELYSRYKQKIHDEISDHLPVVSRFSFSNRDEND
ncbi:endonuclease/exonuclease/phosphatase family protein [Peribacillus butanolivorans]|uniref:endonuclease/exonuclease/phosphatase family protein n=1 Tax=Peribacillus butanolivorans TaxID=421767 RepID=UPI0013C2AF78|nr:endonuclease/exonuclease/phosphatase family protein [Peribacillus butanolivorans]